MKVLVGNTFPLSLIRKHVRIFPIGKPEAEYFLKQDRIYSFWGHANTLIPAKAMFGVDLSPKTERPAVTLDADYMPCLDGIRFEKVLVVSPDYRSGYRPAIGVEVGPDDITGWQCLIIDFS